MKMSSPTGEFFDAKFDGKDYPYKGNAGITSVSLKQVDANTIEETDKREGKVVSVSHMTISPDSRTMRIDVDDKLHGTSYHFVAEKQ